MRLSRGKTVKLSQVIIKSLVENDNVEFIEDPDTIRQKIVDYLQALLREEELIELEVRKKIASQKKEILEGSEEWDLLYRRHYAEELKKKGVGMVSER
jgi:uncharacterized protein